MDRTKEFFRYLADTNVPISSKSSRRPQSGNYNNDTSKFVIQSKEINLRLQNSMVLVQKLNDLVKGDNVLGENDANIQQLIIQLQGELSFVESQINELEKSPNSKQHTASMAQTLRKSLIEVTKDFKVAIQARGENVQKVNQRRKRIGYITPTPNVYSTSYNEQEVEIPMNNMDVAMEEQLNERYDMVRSVETSVTKISEMFAKLSEIIASHDYEIERIDQNTKAALESFKEGEKNIEEFYNKVKNNKWLILKIFAVLLVFALIFILIM